MPSCSSHTLGGDRETNTYLYFYVLGVLKEVGQRGAWKWNARNFVSGTATLFLPHVRAYTVIYSEGGSYSTHDAELPCPWGTLFNFGDSEMVVVRIMSVKVVLSKGCPLIASF